MTLHALQSRTFADQIFSQLAAEIMSGRYAPGDNLPSERTLAELFRVNRQVVREGLKRLVQAGLTSVQQGGGNRVLDYRHSAGLDLMAVMAEHADATIDVTTYWLSIFEMRAAICPDVARLCALRASTELRARIVATAEAMSTATSDAARFALEVQFWELLHEGADNIAYRLALNTMRRSTAVLGDRVLLWANYELRKCDYRRPIAAAIAAGDTERAEAETRTAMRLAVASYMRRGGMPAKEARSLPQAVQTDAAVGTETAAGEGPAAVCEPHAHSSAPPMRGATLPAVRLPRGRARVPVRKSVARKVTPA